MREFVELPADGAGVLVRLVAALLLGAIVAQIYRRTRGEPASSFTATLVLLSVLIALVTQVIGDNVARAFSLVGALSIVRFRTVVRDTQDTAYVIFAVAIGMAAGASSIWVALAGLVVVLVAAVAMKTKATATEAAPTLALPYRLEVRVGLGHDPVALLGPSLDTHLVGRKLLEVTTARQGAAVAVAFRVSLREEQSAHELVLALNRLDGVQGVALTRIDDAQHTEI
jgi:uncharacterized membrane protein YhiD involved in acid resistance